MEAFLSPLQSLLELGGPVVAILLGVSVFSLALISLIFIRFLRSRVGNHKSTKAAVKLWHSGEKLAAIKSLANSNKALDRVVQVAMTGLRQDSRKAELIQDDCAAVAIGEIHELQRGFRTLEAVVQVAPLLGLFGTVVGMIDAFQKLQSAGNSVDPSILAGGIWVALLTTAAGLAVAMPVSVILTWFETKLDDERVAIQTETAKLFGGFLPTNTQLDTNHTSEPNTELKYAN